VTTPIEVRAALSVVTDAAKADVRAVAESAPQNPSAVRASLFAAAPLIVREYASGTAALALDWYEELREAATPKTLFRPRPLVLVDDEAVATSVAVSTESLYDLERGRLDREVDEVMAESLALLEAEVQKDVASGFRDTVTGNAAEDPAAVGWARHARPDGCKFCVMLAARGAVYTEATARFAAHTNCGCVAGPAFDPDAPRADAMQYVASQRTRTDAQRAALRDYLNSNYPDARG
jgi:hypothetical protein